MIKAYAKEKIEEVYNNTANWSSWAQEPKNTIRFAAIYLIRSFRLNDKRDFLILEKIAVAYNLETSFMAEVRSRRDLATSHFDHYKYNDQYLNHLNIGMCKEFANKVELIGFDPLIECLPETAYCKI